MAEKPAERHGDDIGGGMRNAGCGWSVRRGRVVPAQAFCLDCGHLLMAGSWLENCLILLAEQRGCE